MFGKFRPRVRSNSVPMCQINDSSHFLLQFAHSYVVRFFSPDPLLAGNEAVEDGMKQDVTLENNGLCLCVCLINSKRVNLRKLPHGSVLQDSSSTSKLLWPPSDLEHWM